MTDIPANAMTSLQSEVEQKLAELQGQSDATEASAILTDVVKTNDIDRLQTGAALVNTFNYAIQQQAKREQWTPEDFRAFCIALAAMDRIT